VAPDDPAGFAAAAREAARPNPAELRTPRGRRQPFTFARQVAALEGVYRRLRRNR